MGRVQVMPTKIEWTHSTWNPVTGCTKVSAGCQNCYAERMAKRLAGRYGYPADEPFRVTLHEDQLGKPLSWRKSRMVFVCSMGDLFHPEVEFHVIHDIFATMAVTHRHTYQVLTKRPERMRNFLTSKYFPDGFREDYQYKGPWPLPNVWLGVTAENQETADQRIPVLLDTPAAVRFVSCEPLLGPVDLYHYLAIWSPAGDRETWEHDDTCDEVQLDWVICGGESGSKARPMHPLWALRISRQCQAARVPFFFKQWGSWDPIYYVTEDDPDHYLLCLTPGRNEIILNDPVSGVRVNMRRVGKKKAGRELDGRTWDEFPNTGEEQR